MNLIGDVKGKVAVMVDDMIDTAGELCIISLSFGKNVIQMIFHCVIRIRIYWPCHIFIYALSV